MILDVGSSLFDFLSEIAIVSLLNRRLVFLALWLSGYRCPGRDCLLAAND